MILVVGGQPDLFSSQSHSGAMTHDLQQSNQQPDMLAGSFNSVTSSSVSEPMADLPSQHHPDMLPLTEPAAHYPDQSTASLSNELTNQQPDMLPVLGDQPPVSSNESTNQPDMVPILGTSADQSDPIHVHEAANHQPDMVPADHSAPAGDEAAASQDTGSSSGPDIISSGLRGDERTRPDILAPAASEETAVAAASGSAPYVLLLPSCVYVNCFSLPYYFPVC